MPFITCPNGHKYNNSKFDACPYCAKAGGIAAAEAGMPASSLADRIALAKNHAEDLQRTVAFQEESPDGVTVGVFQENGFNPVVGWFVCVDGPDRGRDFRIRRGKNFMGRHPSCDVYIAGDMHVSANHCTLVYDPESMAFLLVPERGALLYHNDKLVLEPTELQDDDRVRLGASTLQFVRFGKGGFQW